MAQNYEAAPTLVMVALLLLAAATPMAYGVQGLIGNPRTSVFGRICCSPTGSCNGMKAGIPGVTVSLNCTTRVGGGTSVILGKGVTGVTGVFNISVPNFRSKLGVSASSLVTEELPCVVVFKLPANQAAACKILKTTNGTLTAAVAAVTAVIKPIAGKVASILCIFGIEIDLDL